ncbi:MAG: hypothetical protein P4L46_02980 [Fimbriimonas sp.]|nr:hypothetical protein [Fimbriimonas sp.]
MPFRKPLRPIGNDARQGKCHVEVKHLLSVILSVACIIGCGENAEPTVPEPVPAVIDLAKGKVDARLIGTWKSQGETYTFSGDGKFKLHIDRMEQTGRSTSARRVADLSGRWSATAEAIMFSVEWGESGTRHRLLMKLSSQGQILELRPTFVTKAPPTIYKKS